MMMVFNKTIIFNDKLKLSLHLNLFFMKTYSVYSLLLFTFFILAGCKKNGGNPPVVNPPSVSGISPASGPVNTSVTISGSNFGTDASKVKVSFNGLAATVQTAANTQITALVPANASTGKVTVEINGQAVDGPVFSVTGPVITGKGCRVVDYSDSASSVVAGVVRHFHFQYNDMDQLVYFGEANVFHYDIVYDVQGHISKINNPNGPPSFTVIYTGDFVTQLNYLDGAGNSYFSLKFSWDVHGIGELDVVDIPKTSNSSSGYLKYIYFPIVTGGGGGFKEYHEVSTDPAHPYDQINVEAIAVNLRPDAANPFFNNTTKDQRFLYWLFFNGIGPIGRLSALFGGGWNDGILYYYKYDINGQRSTSAHERFEFILDNNNNVIKRIAYVAIDPPNFSNYVKVDENIIAYKCK